MAQNWPPAAGTYPSWPPAELGIQILIFSDLQTGINLLRSYGFTKANPTTAENTAFFRQVRCDHGDPCQGVMIVSPTGIRYPFCYCTGADHKSALVLWSIGPDSSGNPIYDLGWGTGVIT